MVVLTILVIMLIIERISICISSNGLYPLKKPDSARSRTQYNVFLTSLEAIAILEAKFFLLCVYPALWNLYPVKWEAYFSVAQSIPLGFTPLNFYPVEFTNHSTGTYLTGVAPADGTGG